MLCYTTRHAGRTVAVRFLCYVVFLQHLQGLSTFPKDVSLLTGVARIYEGIGEMEKAVDQYRNVLEMDSTNIEAIACLGTHHFYSDQPEIALRYYR